MPPNCPGCGASIGTPKSGLHVIGCGVRGDYDDSGKGGRKSRWSRGQQRQMLADALEGVGLDSSRAGELLEVLRQLAKDAGKK